MGQEISELKPPDNMNTNTFDAQDSARADNRFFIVRLDGTSNQVNFANTFVGGRTEIISMSVPIFDNLSADTGLNTVIVNGATYTISDGTYTTGADLATELTTKTAAEGTTWTFDLGKKRMTVSAAIAFTITETDLSNLVLGFDGDLSAAITYTADRLPNFYPFSAILIDVDKFSKPIIYQDESSNDRSCSFMFPIDTFDFVSKTTLKIDKNSFFAGEMKMQGLESIFPLEIRTLVLLSNGSIINLPLSENSTAEIVIKVFGEKL